MGNGIISSVVAVAGFTGLGVAAMYLLDPDKGAQRRHSLLAAANEATAGTEDAVRSSVERARGSAESAVHSVDKYAHDLIDRVTDRFSSAVEHVDATRSKARAAVKDHLESVADKAKVWLSRGTSTVGNARDDLADRVADYRGRAQGAADHLAGKHDGHPALVATGVTAGTVSALAIGAGIAYFLDPTQGRERRGEVLQGITDWGRRVGFSLRQYGRHLAIGDEKTVDSEIPSTEPFRVSNGSAMTASVADGSASI